MTRQYFIRAPEPDRGENLQTCPICRNETKESVTSCPGCGYTFPKKDRRPKLHRESVISFPRSAEPGIGKDLIFL
jgi:hypothetical protein